MNPQELRRRQAQRRKARQSQYRETLKNTAAPTGDQLASAGTDQPVTQLQPGALFYHDGPDRVVVDPFIPFLSKRDLECFPWIGSTDVLDLIANKILPRPTALAIPPFVCHGDRFLFYDKANPSAQVPTDQPYYMSCLDTSNGITITSTLGLGTKATTTTATSATLAGAQYIGATCFAGDGPRVLSAFEDSSVIGAWPGFSESKFLDIDTTPQAHPVGGSCYTPVLQGGGNNSSSGSTTPPPIDAPNGERFLGSFNDSRCDYSFAFRDYFQRTITYSPQISDDAYPILAGQHMAIYGLATTAGQKVTTTQAQQSGPIFGHQVFCGTVQADLNDEFFEGEISGAGQSQYTSTETIEYAVYGADKKSYWLTAASPSGDFSDPYALNLINPRQSYVWALVGALPVNVGDAVTLQVTGGGDSGPEFAETRDFQQTNGTGISITTEILGPGPATPAAMYAAMDKTRIGYGMDSGRYDPNSQSSTQVPPAQCTSPIDQEGWNSIFNEEVSGDDYTFIYETTPGGSVANYNYEAHPLLTEASFSGQWVLVVQATGQRFFMTLTSSTFVYAVAPSDSNQHTPQTLTTTGQNFTFEITDIQTIVWDAVAGDIADMAPGAIACYPANSSRALDPDFTQLLSAGADFTYTTEGGPIFF